jgi:hypothetical protein
MRCTVAAVVGSFTLVVAIGVTVLLAHEFPEPLRLAEGLLGP